MPVLAEFSKPFRCICLAFVCYYELEIYCEMTRQFYIENSAINRNSQTTPNRVVFALQTHPVEVDTDSASANRAI